MISELKEVWRFRELLWTLVIRELRVRYKNSVLGFFWSLLNPLVTVLVITLVFKYVMGMGIRNYSAYVLVAYLPWTFFQFALLDSSQAILSYMPVIKKIYFPRELLPLGVTLANFIHFLLALMVLFVYLYLPFGYVRTPIPWGLLWLPLLLLSLLLLTAGLALFISCLNVFFEDVKYLVSVGLQLLFFLSPVLYFSEQVRHTPLFPAAYRQEVYWAYHLLNPIATLLTFFRKAMLPPITLVQTNPVSGTGPTTFFDQPLPTWLLGVNLLTAGLVAFGGYAYFNRHKWSFVERP